MTLNTNTQELETVIGLEVHLQFSTQTKIFCGCVNVFGQPPNTSTCPVCQGLPGTLPVLNETALRYAIKVALALNCAVNALIKFDRKNYYYPDLPKGYQISQYDHPIGQNGFVKVTLPGGEKTIRIHRAHLEEDAGKLIHDTEQKCSLVDYNRTGTPLMEIVTEPDIRSSEEAYAYLQTLKLILKYLNVSDCDMEKGSLRCDANISVRPKGQATLGTKSEIKNLNSFKAVKLALEYEEERHRRMVASNETIVQETRLWDENNGKTKSMRSKEEAHDYRYFPEPDLVPFIVEEAAIESIRQSLPEFPREKQARFLRQYGLSDYDAGILVADSDLAHFFETCLKDFPQPKKICNWISGPLLKELNERNISVVQLKLTPTSFATLVRLVEEGTLSNLAGKDVLSEMIATGRPVEDIIAEKGLRQISDNSELEEYVNEVLASNPNAVEEIKNGKQQALGFLIGQTMKKTQGKANPKIVGELIKRRLFHE